MNLSGKIKKLRAENNLTQEQLAQNLQVSRSTISSWETGRSYPDLQMIIDICDRFNVSLDFLLREDEKMVRKLNFASKQKKLLVAVVVALIILLGNMMLSTTAFEANPNSLEVSEVNMIRDVSYNGGDPYKDWNTVIQLDLKSNNVFFKPVADDLLVFEDNGKLELQTNWSFSLLNIFDTQRIVHATQSVLIDSSLSEGEIKVKVRGAKSKNTIPFHLVDTNK